MLPIPSVCTTTISPVLNTRVKEYFLSVFSGKDPHAQAYHSSRGNRRTIEYGYSFRDMRDTAEFVLANPIPPLLMELFTEVRAQFIERTGLPIPDTFDTCLVNLYTTEVDLFPHVDKDPAQAREEGRPFYFGEHIVGVTLVPDAVGGLYLQHIEPDEPKVYAPKKAFLLPETEGFCYLLSGENRSAPWYHGVAPVEKMRVSATFRQLYRASDGVRMEVPEGGWLG